ncbi:Uncharacterised protein [uncultured archaeon]|nr:Uncharacterised protein [uncultured archaeon]
MTMPSMNPKTVFSKIESLEFLRSGIATARPGIIVKRKIGIAATMKSAYPIRRTFESLTKDVRIYPHKFKTLLENVRAKVNPCLTST